MGSASKFWARTLGLDPVVASGLAVAVIFFIVSGAVAYSNVQSLSDNNAKIVHTHKVIVALGHLLSSAQNAETGQRGFLLTNNEGYLAPYEEAASALRRGLDEIEELTSDNPAQQSRLSRLRQYVEAKLAELKETIELRREKGFDAALAAVTSDHGKETMDAIRTQLSAMGQLEVDRRVQYLADMDAAQQRAVGSGIVAAALGIFLTAVVGYLIRRATFSRRRDEWLQSGHMGLASAVMGDQSTAQLGDSILAYLARYVDAVAGAIFVERHGEYHRTSTFAVPDDAAIRERFRTREGLLGQAAADNRQAVVDNIPEGYLAFGSALGQDKPRHLLIAPASIEGAVNSVVELGFLHPVDERVTALMEQVSSSVAIAVRSAKYRADLQNLLEETQRQSEELQSQSEELRVSNEELEEQGRALKESQARLEQQQVELEQTNAQLEEQAQQLETQRDEVSRAHASVQLKARELEQASRYKSDFLANMSHELRTPLNSSLILAKLLADNESENLSEEQVNYARTIQSSGNDLLNLINDILDLSKIEAGHLELRPEEVTIGRVTKNLRQLFEPMADQKNLNLIIDIASDVPVTIQTDVQRLEQVLRNLLSNALKFTEHGQVELSVRAGTAGDILFSVSDTGIGIDEEQQASIFDAFHQADTSISRKFGGTGLGLSISRELVRLLGGTISLRSTPGKGSTFSVSIPVTYDPSKVEGRKLYATSEPIPHVPADEMRREAPRILSSVADDRDSPLTENKRVLLVIEDDERFATIVRDMAREFGFLTLVATTAEEALRLAKEYKPSAVILDVRLPDQSGLSVLDTLKRNVHTRHIPIHIISATDQAETALSLGAIGYVVKPVDREQIVDVLQKLEAKLSQHVHRVLIVEDDPVQRHAVEMLLASLDVETKSAGTAGECLEFLQQETFDCMVLDLTLPDASGYSLLETLSKETIYGFPPVIVYTGHDLSAKEEHELRRYSKSIIIKGAKSPERLLDEVTLFMHQVVSELPAEQQKMIRQSRSRDALLEGRRILVVEDDVRNVYALTNVLEPRGAVVQIARNGQEALDALSRSESEARKIDLVLMDVMMPVMDGLTATRQIRKRPGWKKLPIIALTAKAMPDDQQNCIDAGANDYMAKPLDVEKLLSLVRVWMPR